MTIKGQSESRYIKDEGGASFRLPVGNYTLIIHYQGKLFTRDMEITTLEKDFQFTFNLSPTLMGAVDNA